MNLFFILFCFKRALLDFEVKRPFCCFYVTLIFSWIFLLQLKDQREFQDIFWPILIRGLFYFHYRSGKKTLSYKVSKMLRRTDLKIRTHTGTRIDFCPLIEFWSKYEFLSFLCDFETIILILCAKIQIFHFLNNFCFSAKIQIGVLAIPIFGQKLEFCPCVRTCSFFMCAL